MHENIGWATCVLEATSLFFSLSVYLCFHKHLYQNTKQMAPRDKPTDVTTGATENKEIRYRGVHKRLSTKLSACNCEFDVKNAAWWALIVFHKILSNPYPEDSHDSVVQTSPYRPPWDMRWLNHSTPTSLSGNPPNTPCCRIQRYRRDLIPCNNKDSACHSELRHGTWSELDSSVVAATLSPASVAESPHVHHQQPAELMEAALWNWNSLQPSVRRATSNSEKKQPLLPNRHRHTKSHSNSHTRSHPCSDCNSRATHFIHQTPFCSSHPSSLIPGTRSFCSANLNRTFFSSDGQFTVIYLRSYEIFSLRTINKLIKLAS